VQTNRLRTNAFANADYQEVLILERRAKKHRSLTIPANDNFPVKQSSWLCED